jgi:hypothetical protein
MKKITLCVLKGNIMEDKIEQDLKEIHRLEDQLKALIEDKKVHAHASVTGKETYWELYSTLKRSSGSQEEFNTRLGRVRNTWLDMRKKY